MSILIIAEKNSVAKEIAQTLGATVRKDGYYNGDNLYVSWCVGHLAGFAEPEEYGSQYGKPWKLDPLPIIPEDWKLTVNAPTKKQFDVLKKLMQDKSVSEIVNACDAAREGELIFRFVYQAINCNKKFTRLWISSLEKSAILQGFENRKNGCEFDKLYQSGLCRAKADWIFGMNLTRAYSVKHYAKLKFGRVMTTALSMIAQRDEKIANFIKEKYYTLTLNCDGFTAKSERINNQSQVQKMQDSCNGKTAVITNLKKEIKTVNPPKLYDLTTLQREANRIFGFTAQQTLDFTQKLYEVNCVLTLV